MLQIPFQTRLKMPALFLLILIISCYLYNMKTITIFLASVLAVFSAVSFNDVANAQTTNPDTMVLGKLCFVNLKEGEQPVMTALSLFGDRCGSESFNQKPYATDGIRSVFELNEWIEFHPQANVGSGITVMVFKHKADQCFYQEKSLNDESPGYILECGLNKDPEDETNNWGSFYLHPEEVDPGYYDFVFIYDKKVVATMLPRFFKEQELLDKSDPELEELMKASATE